MLDILVRFFILNNMFGNFTINVFIREKVEKTEKNVLHILDYQLV